MKATIEHQIVLKGKVFKLLQDINKNLSNLRPGLSKYDRRFLKEQFERLSDEIRKNLKKISARGSSATESFYKSYSNVLKEIARSRALIAKGFKKPSDILAAAGYLRETSQELEDFAASILKNWQSFTKSFARSKIRAELTAEAIENWVGVFKEFAEATRDRPEYKSLRKTLEELEDILSELPRNIRNATRAEQIRASLITLIETIGRLNIALREAQFASVRGNNKGIWGEIKTRLEKFYNALNKSLLVKGIQKLSERISKVTSLGKGVAAGAFLGTFLGNLLDKVVSGLGEITQLTPETVGQFRELAGVVEILSEMIGKMYKTASSSFISLTRHFAEFGLSLEESAQFVYNLFQTLGKEVKEFAERPEFKQIAGQLVLIGVSGESIAEMSLLFKFLGRDLKTAVNKFNEATKSFLAASKKLGLNIQQLTESFQRLIKENINYAYVARIIGLRGGEFGEIYSNAAKTASIFSQRLAQLAPGAEQAADMLMLLSMIAQMTTGEVSTLGITMAAAGSPQLAEGMLLMTAALKAMGFRAEKVSDSTEALLGVLQHLVDMGAMGKIVLANMFPPLLPLLSMSREQFEKLSGEIRTAMEEAERLGKIEAQIKRIDSTVRAVVDSAKLFVAKLLAIEGVNEALRDFAQSFQKFSDRFIKFLEEHPELAKIVAYMVVLGQVIASAILPVLPPFLALLPFFVALVPLLKEVVSKFGVFGKVFSIFKLSLPDIGKFSKILNFKILPSFVSIFEKLSNIKDIFSKAGVFAEGFFKSISALSKTAAGRLTLVGGALGTILGVFGLIASVFAKVFGSLILAITGLSFHLGFVITGFAAVYSFIVALFDTVRRNGRGLLDVFKEFLEYVSKLAEDIGATVKILFDFFKNGRNLSDIKKQLAKIWNLDPEKIGDSINSIIGAILKKIFEGFVGIGKKLLSILQDFVSTFATIFLETLEDIADWIAKGGLMKLYDNIKKFITKIFSRFGGGINEFLNRFLKSFTTIVSGIADLLVTVLTDVLSWLIENAPRFLLPLLGILFQVLVNVTDKVINVLIPKLGDTIYNFLVNLGKIISRFMSSSLEKGFVTAWKKFLNLITNLPQVIISFFMKILRGLVEAFPYFVEAFLIVAGDVTEAILSGMGKFFEELLGELPILADKAMNKIAEMLLSRDFWKSVFYFVAKVFVGLFNLIIGIFKGAVKNAFKTLLGPLRLIVDVFLDLIELSGELGEKIFGPGAAETTRRLRQNIESLLGLNESEINLTLDLPSDVKKWIETTWEKGFGRVSKLETDGKERKKTVTSESSISQDSRKNITTREKSSIVDTEQKGNIFTAEGFLSTTDYLSKIHDRNAEMLKTLQDIYKVLVEIRNNSKGPLIIQNRSTQGS